MDNYHQVVQQMEAFGVEFTPRDLPLTIPTVKRKTCGKKGKWWYWLQEFRPSAGGSYIVGKFGCYKHGGSEAKVEVDWKPLTDAERERFLSERRAAAAAAAQAKEAAAAEAALSAGELWARGNRHGRSPYLDRKGVVGEACRYLGDGSILVPLLRYDLPREDRLRGLQRIYRDGFKCFTKDFAKTGACLRLGQFCPSTWLVLVCEGYATGLTLRQATGFELPVYVALDAYNLEAVVPLLRRLLPQAWILICADDDWKSTDHEGPNPGRRKAMQVAKQTERCDIIAPVFSSHTRQEKDTDFNDLQARQGLAPVIRQLQAVQEAIRRRALVR
jgi:putative DNA primase/helicase